MWPVNEDSAARAVVDLSFCEKAASTMVPTGASQDQEIRDLKIPDDDPDESIMIMNDLKWWELVVEVVGRCCWEGDEE